MIFLLTSKIFVSL